MSDRPQLKDVVVALGDLSWDDVTLMAVQLGVDMPTITHVETQYNDPGVRTLRSMNSWLQSDPQASWVKIVTALKTINKLTVAIAVEQRYCQSVETPPVSAASYPPTGHRSPLLTKPVSHPSPPVLSSNNTATPSAEPFLSPSDCTTSSSPPASSTTSPPHPTSSSHLIRHRICASSSPSPSLPPPLLDHPMTESTQPMDLPGAPSRVISEPDKARIKQVTEETCQLQEKFIAVLTHTKILFASKESRSKKFLSKLCITLTTLSLSSKFRHLHFLRDEQKSIKIAEDIHEIFDILDRHWNWSDYYLLQRLVAEFGNNSLKQEITKYVAELEVFEKATTIHVFRSAVKHWKHPYNFSKAIIMLKKDASECTLHDIRQLKEDLAKKSSLNECAIYYDDVHASSVVIEVVFPQGALELIPPALNAAFLAKHNRTGVHIIIVNGTFI